MTLQVDPAVRFYRPRGAAKALFPCRATEVLIEGPSGTGKTRGVLEKANRWLLKCPGGRALAVRKTRASMTQSVLVTFENRVLPNNTDVYPDCSAQSKAHRTSYVYPNGSELVIGGMDNPDRIMSTEYDMICEFEATELAEDDHEKLMTRLRNGVMPFQQCVADCNPGPPSHWLNARAKAGKMQRLLSRHEDNPFIYDDGGEITKAGRQYLNLLSGALSGSRRLRLLDGRWAKAEGLVYETYDSAIHLLPLTKVAPLQFKRYITGVDWGFTEPGSIELFGVDGDGRACRTREVYACKQTIDWWVSRAQEMQAMHEIEAFVCDPSEPANIESFRRADLNAIAGFNDIKPGIDCVQQRLVVQADGRPRLTFADLTPEDPGGHLAEQHKPMGLVDELDSYCWTKTSDNKSNKDVPVDKDNHGCDPLRYAMCYIDGIGSAPVSFDSIPKWWKP